MMDLPHLYVYFSLKFVDWWLILFVPKIDSFFWRRVFEYMLQALPAFNKLEVWLLPGLTEMWKETH